MIKPEEREHALNLDEFRAHTFTGTLLGEASSKYESHNHDEKYVSQSTQIRCSACRWQEVRLYKTHTGKYIVYTVGKTVIAGERDFIRLRETTSAFEIIELLTVRRTAKTFLPVPAARALAQASQYDDDIRDAYVNRAVV